MSTTPRKPSRTAPRAASSTVQDPLAQPTELLGGLSPAAFMKKHWQKKPLLIRQAVPGVRPPIERKDLFELAGRDDVESRLIVQGPGATKVQWGWTCMCLRRTNCSAASVSCPMPDWMI